MNKIVGSDVVKRGMAQMQKGGVIMDVVNAEQARIAEAAGAVAVMALERVPSDIRAAGGVARMANPRIVKEVMNAVSIPVMAKVRIGHITEARVLEAMGVDYIDESEVLTPADEEFHLLKVSILCRLFAVVVTLAKHCAVSARVRQCCVPKVNREPAISWKRCVICAK